MDGVARLDMFLEVLKSRTRLLPVAEAHCDKILMRSLAIGIQGRVVLPLSNGTDACREIEPSHAPIGTR